MCGAQRDNLATRHGRPAFAVVGPRLHQLATLVEKICSQVRSQDRPLDCMGQRGLGDLTGKVSALGAPGAQRGTEVVRRDWPGEPLQRPRDCVVINWTTRMPARENDSGCWAPSSFRIATARGESGTRCALRIFILFAGIFHTSPSISAHVAKRISLMRVPVKVRNSKARAATPARRAACA